MRTPLKYFFPVFAALLVRFWSDSAVAEEKSGWTVLFDGQSTAAFRGFKQDSFPTNSWVIDDGTLKSLPSRQVDLITREKYENFALELEWKVAREANSGIMFHVSEDEPQTYRTGSEMQIVDDANTSDGKNPKTSAGSLYALIAPNDKKRVKPAGEWNKARIVIKNKHVEHWLNGVNIVEYDWNSPQVKGLISQSKFNDKPRFMQEKKGYIDFQHHGAEVWLRNIKVRKL